MVEGSLLDWPGPYYPGLPSPALMGGPGALVAGPVFPKSAGRLCLRLGSGLPSAPPGPLVLKSAGSEGNGGSERRMPVACLAAPGWDQVAASESVRSAQLSSALPAARPPSHTGGGAGAGAWRLRGGGKGKAEEEGDCIACLLLDVADALPEVSGSRPGG